MDNNDVKVRSDPGLASTQLESIELWKFDDQGKHGNSP